MTLKKTNEFLF